MSGGGIELKSERYNRRYLNPAKSEIGPVREIQNYVKF